MHDLIVLDDKWFYHSIATIDMNTCSTLKICLGTCLQNISKDTVQNFILESKGENENQRWW